MSLLVFGFINYNDLLYFKIYLMSLISKIIIYLMHFITLNITKSQITNKKILKSSTMINFETSK
jgi:hypothetical protein